MMTNTQKIKLLKADYTFALDTWKTASLERDHRVERIAKAQCDAIREEIINLEAEAKAYYNAYEITNDPNLLEYAQSIDLTILNLNR